MLQDFSLQKKKKIVLFVSFIILVMFTTLYPPIENYFPPTQHQFFYCIHLFSFVYIHFIYQNLFLFMTICKKVFLLVIICENHFLFIIICENLFLTIIICQNLFLFVKTYFHLCVLIFICQNIFFFMIIYENLYDHL